MSDADAEGAPPPIQAAILSRVIILRNAFDPKRLVKNKYLADSPTKTTKKEGTDGDSSNEKSKPAATARTFPDVERQFLASCSQYGFVR
jgi:hypothetical protein